MAAVREKVNVFLSYSHNDASYVHDFLKHLNILKRSGSINDIFDGDSLVEPGMEWSKDLISFVDRSNIVIFFLSPSFLASNYINSVEFRYVLEKNEAGETYIFPVLLRPADISPLFSRFTISMPGQKPIAAWRDRDEAWTIVTNELKEVIQRITNTAALQMIEEARVSKARVLDLGNCGLKYIPAELLQLEWLEGLILGSNDPIGSYEELRFFISADAESTEKYGNQTWITKNKGERNDLSSVDLTLLSQLKKLVFLNIEDCSIDMLSFDFSLFENLKILLAGNNTISKPATTKAIDRKEAPTKPSKLEVLNISKNNLGILPVDFFYQIMGSIQYLNISLNPSIGREALILLRTCEKLVSLDVNSNNLQNLLVIQECFHLKWLNVSRNNLLEIDAVNRMSNLETLYMNYNSVQHLFALSALNKLTLLHASNNLAISIPAVSKLTGLQNLDIGYNNISDIEPLRDLKQVTHLYITGNKIKSLSALSNMVSLEFLLADRNEISEIKSLQNCKKLKTLFVSENAISDINEMRILINQLPNLDSVLLINNPIKNIDPSLLQYLQRRAEFIKYFGDIDEKGHVNNNEVKLILVGNSTAGKSTLRRMLQNKDFEDKEGTTHGITKDFWSIPSSPGGNLLTVSTWDFGGQEYYHETHKLFFSKHAVYVLVWEDATNKNEILETTVRYKDAASNISSSKRYIEHYSCEYWLRNIRHYAPESPVIIVQNKIDKYYAPAAAASTALTRIKKIPDEIINTYNVSDNFDLSLEKIKDEDEDFSHDYKKFVYTLKKRLIQTASNFQLEKSFNTIKEEIVKRKSENKWAREDFDAFCKGYDPKINLDLLINYLTDISVILYFKEREELKKWIFINPVWVSEQIYHVLDNKVLENSGHFSQQHVENKLGADLAEEFISLMKQFQIIFKDERRQEFIAPQYLPDSNVNRYYNIVKSQFLQPRFVLEFPKFLPKTIMNNILSIYAGKAIESSYYKYGVAFETDYDKLNILEYDFKKNQVSFYSKNDDQYNSREVFEAVLSLFENIKIDNSTITSMDTSTENTLQTEKVKVLLSLDGETFINWNKLFLGRSQLQDNMVLIPERGREIHAGAFSTYYQSKEQIRNRKTSSAKKEPIKIFISYSHKDEAEKDELIEHLSGLKRQGIIQHWTDRAIIPGEKWDASIKKNLDESRIILFLISSSFMASNYIQDNEIKAAIERSELPNNNVTLVPIPIRPCDFTTLPLKNYQGAIKNFKAVSLWPNKDEAWLDVVEKLKMLIEEKFAGTTA